MPEDDKKFEAALAGFFHRQSRSDSAGLLCPDPELLAAYHEHTLSAEEAQTVKLHAAGCSHCQQVLAQLGATENLALEITQATELGSTGVTSQKDLGHHVPDISRRTLRPSIAPPSQSRYPWRWIVPAGAIAASLLVGIVYREMRPTPQAPSAEVQVAENRKEEKEISAPVSGSSLATPRPVPRENKEDSAVTDNFTKKIERLNSPASRQPQKPQLPLAAGKVPGETQRRDSSQLVENLQPGTISNNQMRTAETVEVQSEAADTSLVGENSAAPSPIPPQAGDNKNETGSRPATPPVAVAKKRAMAYGDELAETDRLKVQVTSAARAMTNLALILAPDASVMWRVGRGGSIEFSSNGGGQWQRQTSGVSVELISGSAPQPNICWLVGRSGTILLTLDSGRTWRKIASPTNSDLGGVNAADALHATIWELGGQKKFETADGGQSWSRVAGN